MEQQVLEIIAQVMGVPVDEVTQESSPKTIDNWDSLRHIRLILAVEEAFDVEFTDDETASIADVTTLLDILRGK